MAMTVSAVIYALGLGPGDPLDLPARNLSIMRSEHPVYLRTGRHPLAPSLRREGIKLYPLDHFYEEYDSLEKVYSAMAAFLLKEAEREKALVFAVPGNPLVGEPVVRLLREEGGSRGVGIKLFPAPGFLERQPSPLLDPLLSVMDKLLSPEGCPWDRRQNHQSLKKYLIEESYEVIDAIDQGDMYKLCEELGDLLLQVVFHAALAERNGEFTISQVVSSITKKMIHRHPHVFGEAKVENAAQVIENWEAIKQKEGEPKSMLAGVPRYLPALQKAQKVQSKAALVGFDWPEASGAALKVEEEWRELQSACGTGDRDEIQEELGDFFFASVNLCRLLQFDAEETLRAAADKFIRRFSFMEAKARELGLRLADMSLSQLDSLWDEAKNSEMEKY